MVPLIFSHDGAVHKESVKRWKDIASDITVDWVRMAQNVLRYNVVIVGSFFNKGSWMSEAWRKCTTTKIWMNLKALRKDSQRQQSEEKC